LDQGKAFGTSDEVISHEQRVVAVRHCARSTSHHFDTPECFDFNFNYLSASPIVVWQLEKRRKSKRRKSAFGVRFAMVGDKQETVFCVCRNACAKNGQRTDVMPKGLNLRASL
jgi:hypothetical protein